MTSWRGTLLSLLAHLLLGWLLFVFVRPASLPEPEPVMQAVLMSLPPAPQVSAPVVVEAPPAPAPVETPPPPKPLPPPPPKSEPVKPRPEPSKPVEPAKPVPAPTARPVTPEPVKPAPEPPKPRKPLIDDSRVRDELEEVEAESQRAAAEQRARQRREAELRQQALEQAQRVEAEAAAEMAAAIRAREMASQIAQYQLAINRKIKQNWRRPATAAGKLETVMRITLLPGGEVASVVIMKSSGNAAFDSSASEAVERANPLPVPSDPQLFREQFKVLLLKFKPEE